jgi:hypothetical protein
MEFADIKEGETSADGLFTLNEVECLGACVNAPMIQVNNKEFYEHLTPAIMKGIMQDWKDGKVLSAVCCLLSAVCCLLSAVCCLLSAVCRLLSAVCCLLSAVCCLPSAVCCLLSAVCCLPSAVCCLLSAVCRLPS